jgi:hypothetical protein
MGKAPNMTHLPLAIAAFLLSNSDKVRRGESLLQENIETSNADGTWNATNFPSDGSRGVRVIFSPSEKDLVIKRNKVAGLAARANELRPKANARPKETDPKPVAEQLRKDAAAALAELKKVEMEMDVLNEEIKNVGSSQTFTLPFHEGPYVIVQSQDAEQFTEIPVAPVIEKKQQAN